MNNGGEVNMPHNPALIFSNLPEHKNDNKEIAPWSELLYEDFHVAVYKDIYPVTRGHLLFVPQYNSMPILAQAVNDAIEYGKSQVEKDNWDGFNVGLNWGSAAGQTVPWPHVHLIPRRTGDVADPVGGIRNVIPGSGNYLKDKTLTSDLNNLYNNNLEGV